MQLVWLSHSFQAKTCHPRQVNGQMNASLRYAMQGLGTIDAAHCVTSTSLNIHITRFSGSTARTVPNSRCKRIPLEDASLQMLGQLGLFDLGTEHSVPD